MERKLPEHCPGPPASGAERKNESTDVDLGQQLCRKEEELQQLKNELQSYIGKLKGYQTLGQLYAESQKECTGYKQQNDELLRQLGGLMRRISPPTEHSAAVPMENESETAGKRGGDGAVEKPQHSASWLLDFTEEENRDAVNAERPGSASLSSPSFVNINSSSSEESSHATRHSDNFTAIAAVAVAPSQDVRSGAEAAAVNDDSAVMSSIDIQQLTEQLRDAGRQHNTDTASYQDVTSNLIRTSLSVLKLEKQTRVQKAMMEQMMVKLTELQDDLEVKNKTITELKEDRARLAADVKTLRVAHDKALLEARTKYVTADLERQHDTSTAVGAETDVHTAHGEQESGDWLEVQKKVSSAGSIDISAVSTTEIELKRRVDKLSSMITELVAVNRSWDEHCQRLERSHNEKISALNDELADVRRRLDERQKCDEERQRECDELLLSAKKQREDEEMAKEDALTQLLAEKRLRADAEDRCVEFSRKMAELEVQLHALPTAGQTNATQIARPGQQTSSPSSMTSSPANDSDMMLELQMLREQVTVFKEDFDQERRDREESRTQIEHLDSKFRETNIELATTKKKLMDTLVTLRTTKSENQQLKDRFQKVADDLKTLQRQAASRPVPLSVPARHYAAAVSPAYTVQPHPAGTWRVWSCPTCTYENPAPRTSCEMCGRLKVVDQAVYQTDEESRYHHVAGLRDYHATVSPSRPDWWRLPSSNLETDQSSRQ